MEGEINHVHIIHRLSEDRRISDHSGSQEFATESELIGVFTLIGDNYHDSWYKF